MWKVPSVPGASPSVIMGLPPDINHQRDGLTTEVIHHRGDSPQRCFTKVIHQRSTQVVHHRGGGGGGGAEAVHNHPLAHTLLCATRATVMQPGHWLLLLHEHDGSNLDIEQTTHPCTPTSGSTDPHRTDPVLPQPQCTHTVSEKQRPHTFEGHHPKLSVGSAFRSRCGSDDAHSALLTGAATLCSLGQRSSSDSCCRPCPVLMLHTSHNTGPCRPVMKKKNLLDCALRGNTALCPSNLRPSALATTPT